MIVVDADSNEVTSSQITSVPFRLSFTEIINNLDISGSSFAFVILEIVIVVLIICISLLVSPGSDVIPILYSLATVSTLSLHSSGLLEFELNVHDNYYYCDQLLSEKLITGHNITAIFV